MSFQLVSSETIRAPRNLTREGQLGRRRRGDWGAWTYDPPEPPSVGGEAETTHHTWRCSRCKALAVTLTETPPDECGRCEP